jgi:hypothetical protein
MEECSYWEIHYVSCEGNNRWAVAKTPTDWNEYDTMSRIPLGGCGDDVAEIMEIISTSDSNYSWDFC